MVAHDLAGTCSCCGSDTSQLELYLENGFGFSLSEDGGYGVSLVAVVSDPGQDFPAFYEEQLRNLLEWQKQVTSEEWKRWGGRDPVNFRLRSGTGGEGGRWSL